MDEADDKVHLMTFKARLKSRDFVASLAKNPPKTMAEALLKVQKYMNTEEALAAITEQKRTRKRRRKKRTIDEDKKETGLINGMTKEIGGGGQEPSSEEIHTVNDAC